MVARLTNVTRPAVVLYEVMSQEELEKLMLLCCHLEYNHGNISWGGSWAAHSITCLLQDILDGEVNDEHHECTLGDTGIPFRSMYLCFISLFIQFVEFTKINQYW